MVTSLMVTHIWLAQKCLKDIFLITKRLQLTREGHLYKEDTKTEAIIPQECVVHVYYGIDIQPSSKKPDLHVLQNVDHEDILLNITL